MLVLVTGLNRPHESQSYAELGTIQSRRVGFIGTSPKVQSQALKVRAHVIARLLAYQCA